MVVSPPSNALGNMNDTIAPRFKNCHRKLGQVQVQVSLVLTRKQVQGSSPGSARVRFGVPLFVLACFAFWQLKRELWCESERPL